MEHSIYHYHSNRVATIISFSKLDDNFEINVIDIYDLDEDYTEQYFYITKKELESCLGLYYAYMLSILLTKYTKKLEYIDGSWQILYRKNWKGLYFTKNYDYCNAIGWENIPTTIIFPENNNNKHHLFSRYNDDLSTHKIKGYLLKYLDEEEKEIDNELKEIEKKTSKAKVYYIFTKVVLRGVFNEDIINDVFNKIII